MQLWKYWIPMFWISIVFVTSVFSSDQAADRPAAKMNLPEGFTAELLYAVPAEQGSWVSLTSDPRGRLIASDQYGSLYRVDPASQPARVEKLNVQIGFAQGLLVAFDSLYVVAHPGTFKWVDAQGQQRELSRTAGLYRLRDTDGDDQYDQIKLLRGIQGQGEHGPHAVLLSPDGKSLIICAGNHTQLPNPERSRVPRVWAEDQVIPPLPDAGGHAVGIKAPGGWVCRTDPDGRTFELISIGFRNQYDIAFDPHGELFTYDADMEWDIGLPWYRPTRVCHVISGSEFGWRNGSGKWPAYYPDSLPPSIDIGPGSPTGITFGTGARFPAEYQNSLFIADWSYGIIYRVQLENVGSTYRGTASTFCSAPVLPVTDLVIHPGDGAMYFLTGGRKSRSALYRITYSGDQPTAPVDYPEPGPLVALRQQLEELHRQPDIANINMAWKQLGHSDRFIRFAARTAIELVGGDSWYDRAFSESDVQARLEALLAVARTSEGDRHQPAAVASLGELDFESLSEWQQLHFLRTTALILMRMGPTQPSTQRFVQALSRYYPSRSDRVNRELVRVLAASEWDGLVERTIELMTNSDVQEQQIHYAIAISQVDNGWTDPLRKQYLQWFNDAAQFAGGSSFRKYLENIRTQFVARLEPATREQFQDLIAVPAEPVDPYAELAARPLVRQWTMADLVDLPLDSRDAENGRRLFAITQCYKCHMVQGQGGMVGPDLTNAGRRFNPHDLLETIIDPDKEISDQYAATVFQLTNGRLVTGRIANLTGGTYLIQEDMIRPGQLTRIQADEIEAMRPSRTSMMPAGLLDSLTRDEILDLLAYLQTTSAESRTDPRPMPQNRP